MENCIWMVYFRPSPKMPRHQNSLDSDIAAHCMAIIPLLLLYVPNKILLVNQYENSGIRDEQFSCDNVFDKFECASPMKYIFDLPNPPSSCHYILAHFQICLSKVFLKAIHAKNFNKINYSIIYK